MYRAKSLSKKEEEISILRRCALLVSRTLGELARELKPGISTAYLDRLAEEFIRSNGAEPAFKGYRGYPASICVSINEEVVHGIPSEDKVIPEKGLVSVDVGVKLDGFYGDCAYTFVLGDDPSLARLAEAALRALYAGIRKAIPGNYTGDIGNAIEGVAVKQYGYDVVREMVGHGIGKNLHEEPNVPNYGVPGRGVRLKSRMVLAIEPMVTAGDGAVEILNDGWTVVTRDRQLAVHFEHMVVVRSPRPEVLTTYAFIHQYYKPPFDVGEK